MSLNNSGSAESGGTLDILVYRLSALHPHPDNKNKHPEDNIRTIIRSLSRYGQRTPIVINGTNQILKGNGTYEAAKRLRWETIQAVKVTHLTYEQELAYMLMDNKSGDTSELDYEGAAQQLMFLQGKVDLEDTGFTEAEYMPLIHSAKWTPPEDTGGVEEGEGTIHKITFSAQEWIAVQRALQFYNKKEGTNLSLTAMLTAISTAYIRNSLKRKE